MADEKISLQRCETPAEAQLQRYGYQRADYMESYGNGVEEEGSQIDWARWTQAILKRKWLIVAIVAAGVILSALAAFRVRDAYQAFTVISVGKEDTSVVKASAGELIIQNDESLKTKIYLLQSNPLLEEVIVDMKLDRSEETLNPSWRTWPETFRSMAESAKRLFHRDKQSAEALSIPDSFSASTGGVAPEPQYSPAESWRLEPFVVLFKRRLSVEAVSDTRFLKISFTHPDPALAAAICNRLAQTLVARNIENKSEKLKDASTWLERSTRELKARAERAEQALANYTRAHNDIAPQGKGSLTADRLLRLQSEVTRAETDRIIKESLYEDVKHGRVEHVPTAYTDANLAELQKRLGELTVQAAQLDVNYGPDNPQTIEVQQQIAAIKKQIESQRKSLEARLKLDYERALRDEKAFKQALEKAKNEGAQENLDTVQYGILQQEVDTAKALYRNFLEKSSDANFELAQQQNNLRVVEPARIPRITVSPNRKLWVMIGFVFSLMFGVGLAVALELLNRAIRSVDDLSKRLQLPTLAVIPTIGEIAAPSLLDRFKGKSGLPAGSAPFNVLLNGSAKGLSEPDGSPPGKTRLITIGERSPAAEAYRMLRTQIVLSENGEGPKAKTWLITSSQPGEGKTTTTINVAISIARIGRSVLIVDCDLRTPTVHEKLRVNQKPGLSAYLSGDIELEDAIRKLDVPGLSLIPSGDVPHNPCDLIGSQKMREMVKTLAQSYDYVILDSPPLVGLADPLILATIVDNVILVVNGGKSDLEIATYARQELSNVGANIFGVVLNDVALKRHPHYGSYYGSYYGHYS